MRNATKALGTFCLLSAALGVSAPAHAQEGFPKPGKEHALLSQDVGTWEATIKMWTDPQGEPQVSKGTETNTLMPGGLWVLSKFEGEMMGTTFHGQGQNGYDPVRGKYVGTWVDSMSTSPIVMEGTYDEAKKALTMTGETVDPSGAKGLMKIVSTIKPDGGRSSVFLMKSEATGPDFVKVMEIDYAKKGK
ncbi:MAG: DUF1579 domain-containing protein [Isosphaeraceae bacterium]